jgi:hypothetical protein
MSPRSSRLKRNTNGSLKFLQNGLNYWQKVGGAPRNFTAATRDLALQEARGFVDSMTVLGGGGLSSSAPRD